MTFPKTYFTLPTTVYQPNDLIRLGQVIKDPTLPFERLAIPPELKGKLTPRCAVINDFAVTSRQSHTVSVGLMAQIVDALKGEISAARSTRKTLSWQASLLETHFFEPTEDASGLIEQLQQDKAVRQWLRKLRLPGRSAYVITGLKVAHSPGVVEYTSSHKADVEAQLKAMVDMQPSFGAQGAEAKAGQSRDTAAEVKGKPADSYIFAYQLRRIRSNFFTGKTRVGDLRRGGDLYGEDDAVHESDEDENDSDDCYLDSSDDDQDLSATLTNLCLDEQDFGADLPETAFEKHTVGSPDSQVGYTLVSAL
ncbi:hypothetical protein CDD82_7635 [Ophiocordyceps australis]|uniref:Uncharacterized protein n=1 Tax=Ophiocordyceps australis TaxID=1399860 RepID=A0A2C5YLG8_9HYPO|nr:hypothetical protein CDD82_7635 [Ophiocordyceps australis]